MKSLEDTIEQDLTFIHLAVAMEEIEPYKVVELMDVEMRDWLASCLYAYSANQDALTDVEVG